MFKKLRQKQTTSNEYTMRCEDRKNCNKAGKAATKQENKTPYSDYSNKNGMKCP